MAEDRMLSDEILLGLIKKNGGQGGTSNYEDLENKPQIAGVTLSGNKSLADLGIASAQDVKKEFIGTLAEWNALTTAQQKAYDTYQITDDYSEALMPNYSTSEQKTGQKWIDGKDIYFQTVNFGTLPNATTKIINHNIANIDVVLGRTGVAYTDDRTTMFVLPQLAIGGAAASSVSVGVSRDVIAITTGVNRTNITNCYVTLYYTKV